MMEPNSLGTVASAGAKMLADSIVVGSVAAVLAGGLNLLFRDRGAAIRFTVLMVAVTATASLPALRLWLADTGALSSITPLVHFAGSWVAWLIGVWATIATILLVRVAIGVWSLRQLRNQASKPGLSLSTELAEAAKTYCPSRRIEMLISPDATVPAAIGFLRPAVILPRWVVEEMSSDEVRQVVLHELAHLRRYDDWTNLAQKIIKALLFFHPAIWWMERCMSMEREMACDDAVLMRTANARAYAECLARMAERSFLRRGLEMAQAAVSRVRQTSHRVARILGADRAHARMGKTSAVVATVLAIFGIGVVLRAPLLLSFGGDEDVVVAKAAAPEVVTTLRPVQAAWHEAPSQPAKPHVRPAVHRNVVLKRTVAPDPVRVVQASTIDEQPVMRSVLIVVMQDGDGVAVWRITTWHYSPSQQVRSAHKTT